MSTVWAVGRSSHTHRYSQFSAHVVKKNEKKKEGEQTWHWLELSRNLILIFYKTLLSFFSFASEKRHGVIGKVTCSHDTNHLPPLSLASSLPLFSIRPPDWCTKGRVWPFCSHSGDFLLIYPELFNYDWWDGGAWGTGWRADRESGIKWQKEWGRERRKEGREEDEEGGGGDGVGGILWNRRIIEL